MYNFISAFQDTCRLFIVPKNQLKILLAAFLTGVLAYGIFIFHHLLHNHYPFMPWIPIPEQMAGERWLNRVLYWFVYEADIPIFNPLLGLAAAVLSSYYASRLYFPQNSKLALYLVTALAVCYPAVLAPFYYTWTTFISLASWFFALATILFCRAGGKANFFAGVLSLFVMMNVNQGALSILATVFIASCISMLLVSAATGSESDSQSVEKMLLEVAKFVLLGLCASVLYILVARVLGGVIQHGSNQIISLASIPSVWPKVVEAAFKHLLITQPDILNPVKTWLFCIPLLAFVSSLFLCRKKCLSLLALLVLWPAMVCAVKIVYFLVKADFPLYEYRTNLGMAFMYAFCFGVLFYATRESKMLRVVSYVLAVFFLMRFVQADLVRQSVLMKGQMHDLALSTRILSRIEALPGLEDGKAYNFTRIGSYPWYRAQKLNPFYQKWPEESGESHMDAGFISFNLAPDMVFTQLGSMVKLKFDDYSLSRLKYAKENLLNGRKPFPHESSVFLEGDTIYVYLKEHPYY